MFLKSQIKFSSCLVYLLMLLKITFPVMTAKLSNLSDVVYFLSHAKF